MRLPKTTSFNKMSISISRHDDNMQPTLLRHLAKSKTYVTEALSTISSLKVLMQLLGSDYAATEQQNHNPTRSTVRFRWNFTLYLKTLEIKSGPNLPETLSSSAVHAYVVEQIERGIKASEEIDIDPYTNNPMPLDIPTSIDDNCTTFPDFKLGPCTDPYHLSCRSSTNRFSKYATIYSNSRQDAAFYAKAICPASDHQIKKFAEILRLITTRTHKTFMLVQRKTF